MNPMLNIAIRAARKAGTLMIRAQENPTSMQVNLKSTNDFVTNVDKAVESLIIETIKRSYPDHTIVGEESGLVKGKESDIQWIIDPIDGTTNFVKGFPHFAVSIAVRIKGRTEVGVVYNPMTNELFTAVRGEGAQLNDRRLRVNNAKDINSAIIGTGFPFKAKQHTDGYYNVMTALFEKCADFRRTGSAALDLAYVASGRLDSFFEIGLKPWDIAAGELILRESGGVLTDFVGGHNYMVSGNVVAGNPKIVKDMITTMFPVLSNDLKC